MKLKTITLIALLSTSTVFGGFDDNALPSTPSNSTGAGSTLPSTPDTGSTPSTGSSSSPRSTGGGTSASNISGAKMTIKNTQRNNKLTVKSGGSTIVNTASIHLGRGTNASGANMTIRNNQQNNRTNIRSRKGSTVINTANINVD